MPASLQSRTKTKVFSTGIQKKENISDLRFITELGRNLLFTVHPKKVAEKVAGAICNEIGSAACAFVVELDHAGLVSCAFDENGAEISKPVKRQRFNSWLALLPPQISVWTTNEAEFLLNEKNHSFEYVSPIHINGQVKGAIIVGFEKKQDCRESHKQLIDASTQMAAMSVNLSAHYESAIDASINNTKEEHRKFTETVLDALPVSLYVIDRDYRIVSWNRHREFGEQGISRDSVIGRNIFDVLNKYPEQLLEEFQYVFQTGEIQRVEQRIADENGLTKHWLISKIPMRDHITNEITHVISVGEDVTMRVEAMQAVARAEKLAAVGRLAAGIVHEINNPLATISACAEALETRVAEGVFNDSPEVADLQEYLGLIRNESFRCKTITNGLLDFSRLRTGTRAPLNIAETIRYSARLIEHQSRHKNIEIKIEEPENLPLVNADEGQMQQAFLALATNAVDAMPGGGSLTFRSFAEKHRVIIEIQDSGFGIPADDIPKIFEPFFTTKETGQGTGLGLAVCYGIITEHGGRLAVRSTVNGGTTFTIYLPVYQS